MSTTIKLLSMQPKLRLLMVTLSVILFSFVTTSVFGQATVRTDKDDYPPGDTVVITGSGFQPGEIVTLQVTHVGETGDNSISGAHAPWDVVADPSGNIYSSWVVPPDQDELGATLKLTADGKSSGLHAEYLFTDSPVVSSVTVSNQSNTPCLPVGVNTVTVTYTITPVRGANGTKTIGFCATSLPSGVTATFSPATVSANGGSAFPSTTLTLTISSGASIGSNSFTIKAFETGSGNCSTATDFATNNGTLNIAANNTATLSSSVGTNNQTVCINSAITNISYTTTGATGIGIASGLPTGVTPSFSSNTITISGIPTASGTFNYTIPLTGGCGTVNINGSITVLPDAAITSVSGGTTPLCIGQTTDVTANGVVLGGGTGAWSSSNIAVLTVNASGHVTAVGAGTANIIYTITGGCNGTPSASQSITVNSLSTAPSGATSSADNFCPGGSTNLDVVGGTLGTGGVWKWYTGGCGTENGGTYVGAGASITVSPTVTTTYYVRAEGTCNSTTCASILVNVKVKPHVTTSPSNVTRTYGQSASFTVVAEATGITYQWKEYNGVTWSTISDAGIYSGSNTATLTISLPTVTMSGYQYKCEISGDCSPSVTSGAATLTVNAAITTTTLLTSADVVRFMDQFTMTAKIKPANTGSLLTGTVQFKIGSILYGAPITVVPVPGDPDGTVQATFIGQISNLPTASYTVQAAFTSTNLNYGNSSNTKSLQVNQRNASPYDVNQGFYTGDIFAWTTGQSSSTATIKLSTVIKDNNVPQGDLRAAKVTFYLINGTGTPTPITGATNLPVGLIDVNDGSIGTASTIIQLNIGSNNAQDFRIAVGISGAYFNMQSSADAQAIITVSKPVPGGYMVCGGRTQNTNSSGYIKGHTGLNTDFESDIVYTKSGTNPKGKGSVLIRSYYKTDGTLDTRLHTYLINTNAIASLNVAGTSPATATFSSKANLLEQMPDMSIVSIEGGAVFEMIVTQQNCIQKAAITLYRKAGGIWFSNNWTGVKTEPQALNGGQASVAGGGTCNISSYIVVKDKTAAITLEQPTSGLQAYPNPAQSQFNVKLKSANTKDAINIIVYSINGKVVETRQHLVAGQTIHLGASYRPGVYILEMIQANQRKQLKLVKIPD